MLQMMWNWYSAFSSWVVKCRKVTLEVNLYCSCSRHWSLYLMLLYI